MECRDRASAEQGTAIARPARGDRAGRFDKEHGDSGMDRYEVHKRVAEVLRADQAAGKLSELATYQRRYPGHDAAVAAEYLAVTEGSPSTGPRPDPVALCAQHRHNYSTVGEIARGGMGAIFHVRDEVLNRDMAMKVILGPQGEAAVGSTTDPDPLARRFLEEAKITAQLDHPGVVPVYELGADEEGGLFFTMKMVKGQTLEEVFELAWAGKSDWKRNRVLGVFVRVLETLAFAHEKGIVHRDLKPANIMVGDFGEVYVMDWGLAKVLGRDETEVDVPLGTEDARESVDARLTAAGQVLGTPAYMATEQARSQPIDGRADVYAVGSMLYEFLAGTHAYAGDGEPPAPHQVVLDLLRGPPTPLQTLAPQTPPELTAIVERAMARKRSARYHSALDFARDLTSFVEGRVVEAHRTGAWIELRKWFARNRALAASLGAAVLFLSLGLATAITLGVRAELASQRARDEGGRSRRQAYLANIAAAAAELERQDVGAIRLRLVRAPLDLRGWEWRYLTSHLDESLLAIEGLSYAFAPDGERLLVLDRSGVVRAWDLDRGTSRLVLETGVASDSAWLDPGGTHHLQAIRDPVQGDRWTLRVRPLQPPGLARDFHVRSPTFAEVNWSKAFGTQGWRRSTSLPWFYYPDGEGVLTRLDLTTGDVRKSAMPPRPHVRCASPDGRLLFLDNVEMSRYEVLDTRGLRPLLTHPCARETRVMCAAWLPDGSGIVTGAADRIVRLLDAATGEPISWRGVGGHSEIVTSVAVRPDGALLASGGLDHLILLRDVATGALRAAYHGHEHAVNCLSFSADGRFLVSASSGGQVRVWSAEGDDSYVLRGHASYVYAVAFSPDGRRIYSGGWDGLADSPGHIRVWDAASGDAVTAFGGPDRCTFSLCVTSDGSRLVTTGGERAQVWIGGSVCVWDAATGRLLRRHEGAFRHVALSPDESRLAATDIGGRVTVLDLRTGDVLLTLGDAAMDFLDAAASYSPDGRFLACTDGDGTTFGVWNARTYAKVRTFRGHTEMIQSVAFSPDSSRLVTASDDRTARVWDVDTGRELAVLAGHGSHVLTASFHANGERIITGGRDRNLRLWDARTYEEIVRLAGHESYVIATAVSPDGETIASGSGDHTVRIWDAQPLRERYRQRAARRALVKELTPRVQALFDALEGPEEVVAALRADATLDTRRREVALQIALALSVERARER